MDEIPNNIPHMHLFLDLKRKFPELRDGHITDCIQRFGLDRNRCEEDLSRKMHEQHRGYYSPWGGQSRTGSHSSTGGPNSPLSPPSNVAFSGYPLHYISPPLMTPGGTGIPESQFTENSVVGVTANIPYSVDTQTPPTASTHSHVQRPFNPPFTSLSPYSVRNSDTRPVYSSTSNSNPPTTASYFQPINRLPYEQPAANAQANIPPNQNPLANALPSSAPVKHGTGDPFVYEPNRRSSAETVNETRRRETASPRGSDMVQLQLEKKSKLQIELAKRLEEKNKLKQEIEALKMDIQNKELSQKTDVERYKKRIEEIQQDNIHIQSECDEMIREILEFGESPLTEEDLSPLPPLLSPQTPTSSSGDSIPQSSLTRASSGSSIGSGFTTPTNPMNPHPQRAPSPPPYVTRRSPPATSPRDGRPTANFSSGVSGPPRNATGGAAPPKEEGERQWSCSKCTFNNSSFLNECEICGFPHFAVGTTPPLPPQPVDSFAHASTAGGGGGPPRQPQAPASGAAVSPPSSQPHHGGGGGPCYCHRHNFSLGRNSHGAVRDI